MRIDARKMSIHEVWAWRAYRGAVAHDRRILNMVWADDITVEWSPYQNDSMPPFKADRIIIDLSARVIIVDPEEGTDQELAEAIAMFKEIISESLQTPAEMPAHQRDGVRASEPVGAIHELPLRRRM